MKAELTHMCKLSTKFMQEMIGTTDGNLCTASYDPHYKMYQVDLDFGDLSEFYSQVSFFTDGSADNFIDGIDELASDLNYEDYADPYGMLTDEDLHEQVKEMLEELSTKLYYA